MGPAMPCEIVPANETHPTLQETLMMQSYNEGRGGCVVSLCFCWLPTPVWKGLVQGEGHNETLLHKDV
eukprot:4842572-Amphidinium_carterae.1